MEERSCHMYVRYSKIKLVHEQLEMWLSNSPILVHKRLIPIVAICLFALIQTFRIPLADEELFRHANKIINKLSLIALKIVTVHPSS